MLRIHGIRQGGLLGEFRANEETFGWKQQDGGNVVVHAAERVQRAEWLEGQLRLLLAPAEGSQASSEVMALDGFKPEHYDELWRYFKESCEVYIRKHKVVAALQEADFDAAMKRIEDAADSVDESAARTVQKRAKEADLMKKVEAVRDGLDRAVSGDKQALSRVFAARGCERVGRLRLVIETVQLEVYKKDPRWLHLRNMAATIEGVLKELGTFRPWKPTQDEEHASLVRRQMVWELKERHGEEDADDDDADAAVAALAGVGRIVSEGGYAKVSYAGPPDSLQGDRDEGAPADAAAIPARPPEVDSGFVDPRRAAAEAALAKGALFPGHDEAMPWHAQLGVQQQLEQGGSGASTAAPTSSQASEPYVVPEWAKIFFPPTKGATGELEADSDDAAAAARPEDEVTDPTNVPADTTQDAAAHGESAEERRIRRLHYTRADSILEGWVWKRSRYLKRWRRRWLVLMPDHLASFKVKGDTFSTELIDAGLFSRTFNAEHRAEQVRCFCVETKKRRYYIVCDSQAAVNQWINEISKAFASRPGLDFPPAGVRRLVGEAGQPALRM
eukprot:TRINITY_DN40775_c0_g1_i1.p1 TRINITY_DN40775_c0_g1~~TRINITY_DN40775_c0_g1_i1.p1  ORF type:complete len:560 (+),score=167.71 TRINITY_DN40775_c0_g1_i1:85-1764(+)